MLAEILAVVPQTRSIAMITYRPEYRGPLRHFPAPHGLCLPRSMIHRRPAHR